MGFVLTKQEMNELIAQWTKQYRIYAPKRFVGGGRFSETDCIRYGEITAVEEIVFDEKSQYSFKEVVLPVSQTLFFFTEQAVKEGDFPQKEAIVFMRSCDIHGLKRLDEMYLYNGKADYYYQMLRKNMKIVLIGCAQSFENCFCASMGTNHTQAYDMSIDQDGDRYRINCQDELWLSWLATQGIAQEAVAPQFVTDNHIVVTIPEHLDSKVATGTLWQEYNTRCIDCGRCNFVCPTCTCFTMQDVFYSDNGRVGERRRVWASCMVDGFTDVAGGGSYRKENGQRMRFKVLHKVLDFKQRNGYHMCVGCGRCDDICPEYISFSACINGLEDAMKEVSDHGVQ